MLLDRTELEGIVAGRVTLVVRRWRRPTVRAGGTLRTAAGVMAIDAVDVVEPREIDEAGARAAVRRPRSSATCAASRTSG